MKIVPAPPGLFAPGRKHLFVFAHQDDDLPYSGVVQRALPDCEAVWFTNGDGLAPVANIDPDEYAEIREYESIAALSILGCSRDRLTFLRHSEISNYKLFADLARAGSRAEVAKEHRRHVLEIVTSMEECLTPKVETADVVWTLAWQGGHPEHDLTHFMTAKVVREVSRRQGRTIPFLELPAYELTILVPLRFPPWKRGVAHRITLTDEELRLKEAAFKAYKSQEMITFAFKRLLRIYGALSVLRGKPFGFKGFAGIEEFGPVSETLDYTISPHRLELLDYMFEDYEGERIPFYGSVARFVEIALNP